MEYAFYNFGGKQIQTTCDHMSFSSGKSVSEVLIIFLFRKMLSLVSVYKSQLCSIWNCYNLFYNIENRDAIFF